jgi:hypothetical protein
MHIHAIAATGAAAAVTFTTIGFTRSATVTTHNMIVFTIKKNGNGGKIGVLSAFRMAKRYQKSCFLIIFLKK